MTARVQLQKECLWSWVSRGLTPRRTAYYYYYYYYYYCCYCCYYYYHLICRLTRWGAQLTYHRLQVQTLPLAWYFDYVQFCICCCILQQQGPHTRRGHLYAVNPFVLRGLYTEQLKSVIWVCSNWESEEFSMAHNTPLIFGGGGRGEFYDAVSV
jgi:hypothetical protein